MTTSENNLAGCYRLLKDEVAPALRAILAALKTAEPPAAPTADEAASNWDAVFYAPGEVARTIKPEWSNTVKVYEAIWDTFHRSPVSLLSLVSDADATEEIHKRTKGRVHFNSLPRIFTALVKAGAARRGKGGYLTLEEPTDALREAVEAARKGGAK